jgi:uncharacterized protein YaiE (UPF0345 family)
LTLKYLFSSKDFTKVSAGVKISGKITFPGANIEDVTKLTLSSSYWIMDPKAGDTKIVIPFT